MPLLNFSDNLLQDHFRNSVDIYFEIVHKIKHAKFWFQMPFKTAINTDIDQQGSPVSSKAEKTAVFFHVFFRPEETVSSAEIRKKLISDV